MATAASESSRPVSIWDILEMPGQSLEPEHSLERSATAASSTSSAGIGVGLLSVSNRPTHAYSCPELVSNFYDVVRNAYLDSAESSLHNASVQHYLAVREQYYLQPPQPLAGERSVETAIQRDFSNLAAAVAAQISGEQIREPFPSDLHPRADLVIQRLNASAGERLLTFELKSREVGRGLDDLQMLPDVVAQPRTLVYDAWGGQSASQRTALKILAKSALYMSRDSLRFQIISDHENWVVVERQEADATTWALAVSPSFHCTSTSPSLRAVLTAMILDQLQKIQIPYRKPPALSELPLHAASDTASANTSMSSDGSSQSRSTDRSITSLYDLHRSPEMTEGDCDVHDHLPALTFLIENDSQPVLRHSYETWTPLSSKLTSDLPAPPASNSLPSVVSLGEQLAMGATSVIFHLRGHQIVAKIYGPDEGRTSSEHDWWHEFEQEAANYMGCMRPFCGQEAPRFFGAFFDGDASGVLLLEDCGEAVGTKSFQTLAAEDRLAVFDAVRRLASGGVMLDDFAPRNVCKAADGRMRLIDFASLSLVRRGTQLKHYLQAVAEDLGVLDLPVVKRKLKLRSDDQPLEISQ